MNTNWQFGYHCLTWGWENFPRALQEIAEVGFFTGFEAADSIALKYYHKRKEFQHLLEERGLKLASFYGGGCLFDREKFPTELERNLKVADFLRSFDSDIIVVGVGSRKDAGEIDEALKRLAEHLNILGERLLKESAVRAAVHPHLGTIVEKETEVEKLMQWTEPELVFLCPDVAHLTAAGADPIKILHQYAQRIVYLHLKDVHSAEEIERAKSQGKHLPLFCELGSGLVELRSVLKSLREINYSGWLMVELDETLTTPRQSAIINKDSLQSLLTEMK